MSENYLMLNGKRIDLTEEQVKTLTAEDLTEEQVKTLTAEEKKNPFDRVKKGDKYFEIEIDGTVEEDVEEEWEIDDDCYSVANYCTDKAMMEQRALHETLNRLLWRYSEENGGDNEWDGKNNHWSIVRNHEIIGSVYVSVAKENGAIYFKDKKTAQSAIEEIVKPFMEEHPEFVW